MVTNARQANVALLDRLRRQHGYITLFEMLFPDLAQAVCRFLKKGVVLLTFIDTDYRPHIVVVYWRAQTWHGCDLQYGQFIVLIDDTVAECLACDPFAKRHV